MSFELTTVTQAKLLHVNHRKEFHGDEQILAVDLNFEWETGNDALDLLDPQLRQALYWNAAATEGQETLPEVLKVLPNLRVPLLNGGKFKYRGNDKFKGYDFVLDYGLGDAEANVEFEDCAVGKYEVEAKEGGTVVIRWQVSYAGDRITEGTLFKLIAHEQKTVFITLKAPAVLVLVKGGKAPKAAAGEQQEDLLDDASDEHEEDEVTPESALAASAAA